MAAPGDGLRAHQHDLLALRALDNLFQALSEWRRLHVIGIPPEVPISPARVLGVPSGVAQPSQPGHVAIVNSRAAKSRRQRAAIELRVVPRARDRAHVDQALHSVGRQQTDELSNRSGRMPDRQDYARPAAAFSLHAMTFIMKDGCGLGRQLMAAPLAQRLPFSQ
jgi:hypothetical protein